MANFLDAAIEIAREAGEVLMAHRGVAFELKGEHDLVTAADRASETLVIKRLQERFPDHGIFAEEGRVAHRCVHGLALAESNKVRAQLVRRLIAIRG